MGGCQSFAMSSDVSAGFGPKSDQHPGGDMMAGDEGKMSRRRLLSNSKRPFQRSTGPSASVLCKTDNGKGFVTDGKALKTTRSSRAVPGQACPQQARRWFKKSGRKASREDKFELPFGVVKVRHPKVSYPLVRGANFSKAGLATVKAVPNSKRILQNRWDALENESRVHIISLRKKTA